MAEKANSFIKANSSAGESLGKIELAPEVLEVIIGIATSEVQGIAMTSGNFATGVAERLGKVMHGKGVKTEWVDNKLIIDVFCIAEDGQLIPQVAANVQKKIKEAVYHMTSIETGEVNVHVTGIRSEMTSVTE
ncbi:Asp23/Gls24 family envelope stress response protein [Sporosarcina gallistercoris]|uniref:Asp23/Gls24 family envelope stress response protein n=1 Tax=Sporosarcina gallistercoris TaxID=2762245 RepID=A0ABR8PF39_9BACL|nr:Asp23/Gls24 family envelope stress response protein [Sporosarcina gallistercoris]MBD7906791.1 Asp23/Gls24 family envelope stress response protein [Sporosarcina gallistercoris]